MANYRLTNKAVEDLTDIWNYTFDEWSEHQADDYYNMLISSCQEIATNPYLLSKRYDEIFNGLRGFKASKHILFFRMLDSGDVEILRILHERMDLRNRIAE